jgi:hypothetical protein
MLYEFQVDQLFREAADRLVETRRNPVTGSKWLNGVDPVEPQKDAARPTRRFRFRTKRVNT